MDQPTKTTADTTPVTNSTARAWGPLLAGIAITAGLLYLFRDGLTNLLDWWQEPEYNHAYLIPVVAVYLLWLRAARLNQLTWQPAWTGVAVTIVGLAFLGLGEISAVYVISQYAFVLTVWGLALTVLGFRGVAVIWPALLYLIFMIPLPRFFQFNLSSQLQLISSWLGVQVIRAAGAPVFLEGNVIDLGIYQLQVADACSGLRYLFPLMSFGFLSAAIFNGRSWQRGVLFFSTIPITVLMNSFRVGMIGILVNRFGIAQAEGFLHYFEGWVVFMACVAILFLQILIFARMNRQSFGEAFAVDIPPAGDLLRMFSGSGVGRPAIAVAVLVVAAAVGAAAVGRPLEMAPERASMRGFPLVVQDWRGVESTVDKVYLDELQLTDYVSATYQRPNAGPIDLWIAYYDSQRKGASVHSPRACLPGGGWRIEAFDPRVISGVGPGGEPLTVNRALISMGGTRALVYYWFVQQGRILTNEYLVKWYIFWDALTRNRTDGALVRVITQTNGNDFAKTDREVEDFIRAMDPHFNYFLPQQSTALHVADARP